MAVVYLVLVLLVVVAVVFLVVVLTLKLFRRRFRPREISVTRRLSFHRYGGNTAAVALPPGLVGSDPMSPSSRLLPTASMAVLNTAVTVEVVVDDAPLTEHVEVCGNNEKNV